METVKKKKKMSKRKITLISLSCVLLCILIALGVLFGPGLFAKTIEKTEAPSKTLSMRKEAPTDGTLPTEVKNPIDNIAYLAYVLDHQPYYKNYAYNSTKATGYEQVTKSWKDFKGAELTGIGKGVMVCSDLTHSLLVKSATQTCFVGGEDAYLRMGNKPGANTLPTEIAWSEDLKRYTHDDYLTAYGEFSTELTVYVINEETVSSVGEVIDNGDGTYSQAISLTPQAACWYQYGMKTRGSLKGYPEFHSIEITFTYDAKWQVIESYCEEEATIAPSALGGSPQKSSSKTTTTFTYGAEAIDEAHFAYFENYYKSRLDISTDVGTTKPAEPEILDVLGSAFRNVVDANSGQQFALGLNVGQTGYDGKVFAKLGDLGDVLGTLDVRLALEKKDSGKQDLYLEFAGGNINVYYSNGFAMTANLSEVATSVTKLTDKIKQLSGNGEPVSIYSLLADGADEDPEFDFNALLDSFGYELTGTGATITIDSDNLLGLGLGVDAVLTFSRTIDEEGGSIFDLVSVQLNSLSFGGEQVDLKADLTPDETPVIERQSDLTSANLADYINGVYNILDCNTVKVDLTLADKLVEGLSLEASAYVRITDGLAARLDAVIDYKGLTAKFNAYYAYDENYGKVYLNLTELNGQKINAKVYCSVDEVIETVTKLLEYFGTNLSETEVEEGAAEGISSIINKVLNLNFGKIIKKVSGNSQNIGITLDVDEILTELEIDAGLTVGEIELVLNNGEKLSLQATAPALGLDVTVSGSEATLAEPEDKQAYVDVLDYLNSIFALLNSKTFEVKLHVDGAVEGLTVDVEAYVPMGESLSVKAEISVEYKGLTAKLNAYYVYDENYGKAYLNFTELNGQKLDTKVYCDIKDVVTAVEQFITIQTSETEETEITVAKAVEVILNLDFNKLLKVDNEKLQVTVNVDEVLADLGLELGISVGEVKLEYTKATSTLNVSVPEFGVTLSLCGSEEQVIAPADKENYVDILDYVNNIASLVLSGKYHLELEAEYKGVSAELEAEVEFKGENKNILAVQLNNVVAKYENITLGFNAYYEIDLTSDTYGKVYLHITTLNDQQLNAKIYCDIKDVVTAVEQFITIQTSETEETEITVAKAVEVILNLDFNKLLNVDNDKLQVTVNVDEVLADLGLELGISVGEVKLEYTKATSTLNVSVPEFGVTLSLCGSEEQVIAPADKENYIDILDYVNNIANLVLGGKYHVEIAAEFKGVSAELEAEVEFKGENKNILAVQLNNVVAKYENITLDFNAYYEIDLTSDTYGAIYLNITKLNNQELNAKIYCDIKEVVTAVEQFIAMQTSETEVTVAKAVEVILNLDFNKLLKVDNEKLQVTVNVDEVLADLGLELGIAVGEVKLEYTKATSTLDASIPEYNATLSLCGSKAEVKAPEDIQNYLDVKEFIDLIDEAVTKVEGIATAQDAAFKVNASYKKDGVTVNVEGFGEVIWVKDNVKAGLSLDVTVTENGNTDTFKLNFTFDQAVMNSDNTDNPFVIITLNDAGLKVYRNETDNLTDTIGGLISAIKKLTVKDTDSNADILVAPVAVGYSAGELPGINELLYNENVNKVLSAILSFASDLTVKLENADGADVKELLITHAKGGSIKLGADGCLNLNLTVKGVGLSASVEEGNGDTVNAILKSFESGYTFYEDINSFAEYLFNEVLKSLDNLTLKDVLGTDSYVADFLLDGNLSGLQALKNVYIKAELYYSEDMADEGLGNNLIQTDFHFSINGTDAEANLSYSGRKIYVSLTQVGSMKFSDLKFKVGADELYTALEELVRLITDTNLISLLSGEKAFNADAENIQTFAENKNSVSVLTEVLYALLNCDLEKSFKFDKAAGTAEINIDDILQSVAGVKIGTVKVCADMQNHTFGVKVGGDGSLWLTLDANPAGDEIKDRNKINPGDYIDVNFISTLLADLRKTVTDENGEIRMLYTFTGSLTVNVILAGDIKFNDVKLSLGLDEQGEIYFSFTASQAKSTLLSAAEICVTYSHGLITMGRNINSSEEVYKIMTIEYLLDNLFGSDSPLAWLVGLDGGTWAGIIKLAAKDLKISSGLTTPQTYSLYEQQQVEADKRINIAYFVKGLKAVVGGQTVSEYGNSASETLSKFGNMDGNFYAVDLQADELTGGVLTQLNAALTRGEQGISGIKAYGAIQSYVKFTVDLKSSFDTEASPNYYTYVKDTYEFDPDYEFKAVEGSHYTPVFGCFEPKGKTVYVSSNMLETIYFDVYDGERLEKTLEVLYGSTVNLVSPFPELAADGKKLIYVNVNGEKLPNSVVITDGGMLPIIDGRVSIYKSSEEAEAVRFDFAGIINPVTAALTENEALAEYSLNGYTFLGWYNDSEFNGERVDTVSQITNLVDGVKAVYGWYVKTEVMVNGVIYTFSADNGGHYTITGYDSLEIKPYTLENSVLELENSFTVGNKEYKVTAIGESAFANAMLKNVIVPANITTVGKLAFFNNYGIKTVVFLADSVYMQGGTTSGYVTVFESPVNDSPFYNCGTSDGSTATALNVYYNQITCDSGKSWNHIFRIQRAFGVDHYYIGSNGGSLNGSGTWAYAEYELNANGFTLSQFSLVNGLTTDTGNVDCTVLEDRITNLLDGATSAAFVNGYTVTATSVKIDGKYRIVITVNENAVEERYYKLTFGVSDDSAANALLDAELKTFGESTYVKNGTSVTVRPAIEGFTVNTVSSSEGVSIVADNDNLVFTMPGAPAELTVNCVKKTITRVTVISNDVQFTYDGSAATNQYVIYNMEEGVTQLKTPQADGYYFVGWTYLEGETLVFTDSVVTYGTYYPVWAESRAEITEVSVIAAGTVNDITVSTVDNIGFYKWYTDKNFVNEATSLTTATTVLYSRMQYNLNVTVSGKDCREVAIGSLNDASIAITNRTITNDYTVYEGETIYLQNVSANKKDYSIGKVTAEGKKDITGQIYIKEYIWIPAGVKTVESSAKLNGNTVSLEKEGNDSYCYVTVSGNLNFTFTNK